VATTTTRSLPRFNPGAVTRAFASVGIRLHNPDPTGSAPHFFTSVTMLTGIRLPEGWTLAAYIYPTPNQANASFSQDAGGWSASGIASVQVKNVVVIVIPRGHTLTHKARPFPMPALVYTALHLLTRTA
jgi:hypothetical protein